MLKGEYISTVSLQQDSRSSDRRMMRSTCPKIKGKVHRQAEMYGSLTKNTLKLLLMCLQKHASTEVVKSRNGHTLTILVGEREEKRVVEMADTDKLKMINESIDEKTPQETEKPESIVICIRRKIKGEIIDPLIIKEVRRFALVVNGRDAKGFLIKNSAPPPIEYSQPEVA
jgi:4-hydroxy-3-methylbut-2-enyl diphosphate reductase IspH